jgi:hypothetical protein
MSIDRWRVPKGPGTHVLMDGGILYVPYEEQDEFFSEYIAAINSGTKLYVVEQKTDRFKFFVDLDYKAQEKLSDADLIQFCSIIHDAIDHKGRCLIARAQPRAVKEGIKTGVHIHWPDLIVDRTQALNLRTKIVIDLSAHVAFDWAKIIDASVYGGSGLRMLWSHKKPTGDPYIPWMELGGSPFMKDPVVHLLALFAVRTDEKQKISENLADSSLLEEFIQKYLECQERARVKKVQRHEHDGWYVQTDSRFCERIHKAHKNNHVWFHINCRQISQRCFDDECREFIGKKHNLSPTIVEQLKDVAIVGSPSTCFLMDIFPDGHSRTFQKVRTGSAPIFGSGPGELETVLGKSPRVRTVGFNPA